MKKVVILRTEYLAKIETLCDHLVYDGRKRLYDGKVLELPWRNNQSNISSIPAGVYPLNLEWSPKFSMMLWEIKDVPNRSECKFHSANYVKQLNGCMATGSGFADIDNDGIIDIQNSYASLMKFHDAMGMDNKAILHVIDLYK